MMVFSARSISGETATVSCRPETSARELAKNVARELGIGAPFGARLVLEGRALDDMEKTALDGTEVTAVALAPPEWCIGIFTMYFCGRGWDSTHSWDKTSVMELNPNATFKYREKIISSDDAQTEESTGEGTWTYDAHLERISMQGVLLIDRHRKGSQVKEQQTFRRSFDKAVILGEEDGSDMFSHITWQRLPVPEEEPSPTEVVR